MVLMPKTGALHSVNDLIAKFENLSARNSPSGSMLSVNSYRSLDSKILAPKFKPPVPRKPKRVSSSVPNISFNPFLLKATVLQSVRLRNSLLIVEDEHKKQIYYQTLGEKHSIIKYAENIDDQNIDNSKHRKDIYQKIAKKIHYSGSYNFSLKKGSSSILAQYSICIEFSDFDNVSRSLMEKDPILQLQKQMRDQIKQANLQSLEKAECLSAADISVV